MLARGQQRIVEGSLLEQSWQSAQDTQFKLEASGMKVASLHGEMSKMERQQVLAKFRAGGYRAMVRRGRGSVLAGIDATAIMYKP